MAFAMSRTPRVTRSAKNKNQTPAQSVVGTSSSSAARRKQLEFEAAQAKAKLELQAAEAEVKAQAALAEATAAQTKARIEKDLLDKKLAADIAELQSGAPSLASSRSNRSKVKHWLETSNASNCNPCGVTEQELYEDTKPIAPCLQPKESRSDIGELANALCQAINVASSKRQNPDQHLLSRLAISKDLPLFFGDPLEWLHFKEAFNESTKLCNYTDAENLWRLRKCLRGDAKEATSSLLISATSPTEIISTLELRFGRPENIMRKISSQIKKIQPLPYNYHSEIVNFSVKIRNCVAAIKCIKEEDYLRSPEQLSIVVSKLPSALITKWADYLHNYKDDLDLPKLEMLSNFLHEEAIKIASSGVSFIQNQSDYKRKENKYNFVKTNQSVLLCNSDVSYNNSSSHSQPPKCQFCRRAVHALEKCTKFIRAMRKDRWRFARINKLCYKCLGKSHHDLSDCAADSCDIEGCGQPHHRLLHWPKPAIRPDESEERSAAASDSVNSVNHLTECPRVSSVLLKIVPLTVRSPSGVSVHTHALLDDGATVTLVASDIADQLGLSGKPVTMRARSAWDSELVCESEIVSFDVSNNNGETYNLCARKMSKLDLPTQCISNSNLFSKYKHLGLCNCNAKPKILIGQDNFHLMAPIECIRDNEQQCGPYVTKCLLGWCVHGRISDDALVSLINSTDYYASENVTFSTVLNLNSIQTDSPSLPVCPLVAPKNKLCSDLQLHDIISKYFSLESIGICSKPRCNPDDVRAIEILNRSSMLIGNTWFVGLPWKYNDFMMPDSYPTAYKRLLTVERKINSNEGYATRYRERINHLMLNNYARKITQEELVSVTHPVWYLPHFGVDNPNKKKLRLVFDAAAKSRDLSLNDFLLQGPDLLQSLLGIMFRFREQPVGVIGDIKDMFLRIKIRDDDFHGFRFLWRESKDKNAEKYVMTSLIFGANCSPFIAQYICQNKNTERFQNAYPDAVNAIRTSQYMDDYIDSFSDDVTTRRMVRDVSFIHSQGGFEMRNWMSNSLDVLKDIPKHILSDKAVSLNLESTPERTLGLLWYPRSDAFAFDVSLKRIPNEVLNFGRKPTKREMLSIIMSVFDVHGFLAPFTVQSKIYLQQTWKIKLSWDQEIPDGLFTSFREWLTQLKNIANIRIPRWYFGRTTESSESLNGSCTNTGRTMVSESGTAIVARQVCAKETALELHIFCDASLSAYAAVGYWLRRINNEVFVSFIASKSRVTPIKPAITIPRLELQAALLGCRLASTIIKEHRFKYTNIFYWTDSTTVLSWIRNDNRSHNVFVANRLGEIDQLSSVDSWHYVPSELNIADLATKARADCGALRTGCEWFTGPAFLFSPREQWPQEPEPGLGPETEKDTNEFLNIINSTYNVSYLPVPEPNRFSSWLRLLRSTATVLLFIEKCRGGKTTQIDFMLMRRAEILVWRYAQLQSFHSEINLLKANKPVGRGSRIRTLTPILNSDGLLCAGGRINAVSGVGDEVKRPIILDGRSHVTRLLVTYYHIKAAHGHNEMVVNELRQRFWVIGLRPTVRTVASRCLFCRIKKANPEPPRQGDLPEERLKHHERPFTVCGLDLFGPIEISVARQRPKRYGVLFTCLTVRAVHIEVVPNLTADSLIMSLRRMAARRGWPRILMSDNGTNMRGASNELKQSLKDLDNETVIAESLNYGVDWRFIPPASPHMGGAWERLIRSVKAALKVVLKERAPREEVLTTVLAEVENMINSRPLTHVSVDPSAEEALTPNHFLLGSSSAGGTSSFPLPPLGTFNDDDLYLRRQWRIAQRLIDLFWKRWLREVLPVLVPRSKWNREGCQLKVGDFVVIVDPSLPRNTWPKGIVARAYTGSDNRVRVVDVKTKTGILKRPVARVAPLTFVSECRESDTRGENVGDSHTDGK